MTKPDRAPRRDLGTQTNWVVREAKKRPAWADRICVDEEGAGAATRLVLQRSRTSMVPSSGAFNACRNGCEMLTNVAKPLGATTTAKRPLLPTIRCHKFAASTMKNCPAVSQERVDLRLLLRAVKLHVDLPHLLHACLQRISTIDYPA